MASAHCRSSMKSTTGCEGLAMARKNLRNKNMNRFRALASISVSSLSVVSSRLDLRRPWTLLASGLRGMILHRLGMSFTIAPVSSPRATWIALRVATKVPALVFWRKTKSSQNAFKAFAMADKGFACRRVSNLPDMKNPPRSIVGCRS